MKKKKEARKEREEENPPTILSRHESTSGAARSCLRVAVSMSQRSRLVSSRLYLSRGPLESPFPILLVVVLILAKCCDQHPPFVCPPPFVSTRLLSLSLSLLRSVTPFIKRCECPGALGSWGPHHVKVAFVIFFFAASKKNSL